MESMRKDMEREWDLREVIEKLLQVLRTKDYTTDAESTNTAAIVALEVARSVHHSCKAAVEASKAALAKMSTNFVGLFADEGFLPSDMTYLRYYGFSWPTTPSEEAFYVFATLLTSEENWDSQIRSPSSIRQMHQELRTYVEATKDPDNNLEEALELDRCVQTFSSCCDVIKQSSERTESMSQDGAQRWIDEHEKMWTDAKLAFQSRFRLDSKPPIYHFRLINDFADIVRAQKAAQESNETAPWMMCLRNVVVEDWIAADKRARERDLLMVLHLPHLRWGICS